MKTFRCKAPVPGNYGGTFNGCPAIFVVTADTIHAWWITAGDKNVTVDAWDIEQGSFAPNTRGMPARCTIRKRHG